jgi:uncharacterized protein YraI
MLRNRKTTLFWGMLAVGMIVASLLLLFAAPNALFADGDSWTASYWNNRDLSGNPVLVQEESAIDHNWKGLSPDPVVNVDNFSARWVRTYNFAAGTYRFKATMDDGMRAWIDGKIIIDDWQDGKVRTVEANVKLNNGPHKLTVEYYEAGGKAVAGFTWVPVDGSGTPPQPMPPMYPPTQPMPPMAPGGPGMPPSGDVVYPVGVVKSPYLNMRTGPGSNYHVIAVLSQGTEVFIIARSSGSTWYLVKTYGGVTGWVKRYYIHTDFPYTSLQFAENMQQPNPMPPSSPPKEPSGAVNTGALNVRIGPGTNYRAIAVVNGGTNVLLLGRSSGGSWLKVKLPTGTVGWVKGYYINTSYPTQNLPVA